MRTPVNPARLLKTPHIAVLVIAAIVIPLVVSGFVWAKKGVTVVVDGESLYYTTEAETVSQVLEEVDIVLAEGDLVSPLPETPIADGTEIVVRQAIPVTLDCNGTPVELRVIGSTVADALVSAGLDPSLGLHVSPAVDAPLSDNMTITATDVFVRVVKEEVVLPFETEEREDGSLLKGQKRTVRKGVDGAAIRIYEVLVVGETETRRIVRAEEVTVAPVNAVVAVGTKEPPAPVTRAVTKTVQGGAVASAAAPEGGTTMRVSATAYTPWDPGCGGLTVIERKISAYRIPEGWGIVAVDPTVIKLGTKVYVPGYGYAVAADIGGAIKGDKIDVCYWAGGPSVARSAALTWGRRSVTITILD